MTISKRRWIVDPDWEDPGMGSDYGIVLHGTCTSDPEREVTFYVPIAQMETFARHVNNYVADAKLARKRKTA